MINLTIEFDGNMRFGNSRYFNTDEFKNVTLLEIENDKIVFNSDDGEYLFNTADVKNMLITKED